MRLAVYGGSFDPPHRAHVLAAEHVLASGAADRVLVVPVFRHAFSKEMTDYEHRVKMCELAFSPLPGVEVSRIEAEIEPPNYTVHTLRALAETHPGDELRFVVGTDALRDSHKWHRFDEVCRLAPLVVLGRVGVDYAGGPEPVLPDVSSTEVRSWLGRRGEPGARQRLSESVPRAVLDYIEQHRLYGPQPTVPPSP